MHDRIVCRINPTPCADISLSSIPEPKQRRKNQSDCQERLHIDNASDAVMFITKTHTYRWPTDKDEPCRSQPILESSSAPASHYETTLQQRSQQILGLPLSPLYPTNPSQVELYCLEATRQTTSRLSVFAFATLQLYPFQFNSSNTHPTYLAKFQQQWLAAKPYPRLPHDLEPLPTSQQDRLPLYLRQAIQEAQSLRQSASPLAPTLIYYTHEHAYMLQPIMLGQLADLPAPYHWMQPTTEHVNGLMMQLLQQVVPHLQTLHQQHLFHGAIHPRHILFRGATIALIHHHRLQSSHGNLPMAPLVAPESIQSRAYSPRTDHRPYDIWCLGHTLLWLTSTRQAQTYFQFSNYSQAFREQYFSVYQQIFDTRFDREQILRLKRHAQDNLPNMIFDMFEQVAPPLRKLVKAMCEPIPQRRPTIDHIAQCLPTFHPKYALSQTCAMAMLEEKSNQQLAILSHAIHNATSQQHSNPQHP